MNLANLPGVLLYFHHEIFMDFDRDADGKVVYPVRHKFGITRFLRFKITMKSTREAFDACLDPKYAAEAPGLCQTEGKRWRDGKVGHQFMRYTAFDSGMRAWKPPGWPSVGCLKNEVNIALPPTAGSARSIPASRAISRRRSVGGSANSI